ncbi:MAG: sensor histidine kinase [Puniceicoccaceae bacterium]
MRHCRFLSLLVLITVFVVTGVAQPVEETVEDKVKLLRQICRYSPSAAIEMAQAEGLLPELAATRQQSIELILTLAPAIAMQKGFETTRQELQSLLVEVLMAPTPDDVIVRIQAALADLSTRNGEYEAGLGYFLEGLKGIRPEAELSTKLYLLESGIRASLRLGRPFLARDMLQKVETLGGFANTECQAASFLLRAMTDADCGDADKMHGVLEQIEVEPGLLFREEVLKQFWLQKANFALLTNKPILVERFLDEAEASEEGIENSTTMGWFYWYRAVHAAWMGDEDAVVRQFLDQSADAFQGAGSPGTYPSLLAQYAREYLANPRVSLQKPFLDELAAFAFRDGDSHVVAFANAARGELLKQSGNSDAAYTAARTCYGLLGNAMTRADRLESEWNAYQGNLFQEEVEPKSKPLFYTVLLFLLFAILVLVLILRIRTQHHINERLRESVEKSRIAEEAAEHANRLKSQFVSNISHEIKAPMSGLVGMASILDELVTDPAQRKYLDTIRVCSRNLLVLMDDLLDLGRMESGRLEMEQLPFRPSEIFSYCEQLALRQVNQKNLRLELEIDETVPDVVIGDSTRFGQVLTNLINNAIKYTEDGHVRVAARYEKLTGDSGRMIIDISDTGVGISAERLNTVFEPFNQSGKETSAEPDGNGLGLAISKRLVDLMSGSIMVVSDEGKGSTFTVTIPFDEHFEDPESA